MYIHIHIYVLHLPNEVPRSPGQSLVLPDLAGLDVAFKIVYTSRFVRVILAQGPC